MVEEKQVVGAQSNHGQPKNLRLPQTCAKKDSLGSIFAMERLSKSIAGEKGRCFRLKRINVSILQSGPDKVLS